MRYVHTNIVARDWQALARFYVDVFGCEPVGPARDMRGAWLDRCTGLSAAHLRGRHFCLPGGGEGGPTLEIFQYDGPSESTEGAADRIGFGHIAFHVDDVRATWERALAAGGRRLGELSETDVEGAGHLTVVYVRDPEGNIVELQNWS